MTLNEADAVAEGSPATLDSGVPDRAFPQNGPRVPARRREACCRRSRGLRRRGGSRCS